MQTIQITSDMQELILPPLPKNTTEAEFREWLKARRKALRTATP